MKIAILGATGIGQFHARNFNKLGVEICSILCSSNTSGKATSKYLKESLDLNVEYFDNLELLISKSKPEAVVISTPNELHYDQILHVLDNKIPIFCEKPLFWNKDDNYKTFSKKLNIIAKHPNRALFVNTSAGYYIWSIRSHLPHKKDIYSFNFKFTTQGNKKNKQIAVDLLPHGLALVIDLFGYYQINSYKEDYSESTFKCNFIYSGCLINFEFNEGSSLKKEFMFSVNEKKYIRKQRGGLKKYNVYIDCISQKKVMKIDDPFEIYASRFIDFCSKSSNQKTDDFFEISHNLDLMAKILLLRNQKV